MDLPVIRLGAVPMHPALAWARQLRSGPAKDSGKFDYKRWSLVLGGLADCVDLLDVGIGRGQFPDAARRSGIRRVRGADRRKHVHLTINADWEYVAYDLTEAPPPDLVADTVTCMECIEHIADPGFSAAVANLKAIARKRLIVSVPFMEPEPLPAYHHQRFDAERLLSLFPGADLRLLAAGTTVRWAMLDWRPA